jgi:hypothetical protein
VHPAKRNYEIKYPGLDRLAMQKQQKSMFLTNGSWANREQPRNPACIQWLGFDPVVQNPTTLGFMKVKLRVRVSDRVAPGTEQLGNVAPQETCSKNHIISGSANTTVCPSPEGNPFGS